MVFGKGVPVHEDIETCEQARTDNTPQTKNTKTNDLAHG